MDKITQLLKQMHEMAEYSGDSPKPLGDFLYEGMLTPGYEAEFLKDPAIKTEDITDADKIKRADPYQNFAKPVVPSTDPQTALELRKRGITNYRVPDTVDNKMAGRPEYENVFADQGPQVQMNVGGRVAQAGSTLTADEYQQNLVDFYNFGGIEVKAAPAADPADPDPDPDPGPRIIPVDYQDHQEENAIFTAYDPVFGGNSRPDSNRYFSTQNYDDYIVDYDLTQPRDKSGNDEFSNFIGDMLPAGGGLNPDQPAKPDLISQFFGGALGTMASTITAKINRDNAAKIAATGGTSGSMYKFKGRVLSRAPGSKITNGQLGGMDQATALRNDEINKRFIPGTMTFNSDNGTDGAGFTAVATQAGYALDPFGTYHSAQRREDGHMMQGGGRLREVEFRNKAEELGIDISGMTKQEFRDAALAHKQHVDGVMKGSIYYGGFFHKTRSMSRDSYNSALALRGKTSAQFIIDSIIPQYGLSTPTTPVTTTTSTTTTGGGTTTVTPTPGDPGPQPSDDGGSSSPPPSYSPVGTPAYYDDSDEGYQTDPGGGSAGSSSQDFSAPSYDYDATGPFAEGGRVGLQMGGTAPQAAPAGFVERPPSQVSEAATVADDKPMSVPEGTFVINAAAVEFAGEGDIAKMLNDAYKKAGKKGSAAPSKDQVDVAVSRGEVLVPPAIAKIIGYDRLEKINNRGKKETSKRIEENGQRPAGAAGGGFLTVGKYAEGDKVRPTPKPDLVERRQDEAIADVELRADLEEFIRDDQLARLGWDLYTSGELRVAGLPTPFDYSRVSQDDGTQTVRDQVGYGFAGVYNPAPGKNKRPVFPQGQGFSKEQEAKTETLNPSTTPNRMISPLLSKVGITPSETPTASYFSEPMYIPTHAQTYEGVDMGDRATVMITLAHELRHAAMNYMHYDLGAPRLTRGQEERMMDVMDEKTRREVSKKNSLVLAESPYIEVAQRGDVVKYMSIPKKQVELYNNLAAEVLKERGVPPVAKPEEKGFISRYIDGLFGKSNTKKRDEKPVDYESEALQSPQF